MWFQIILIESWNILIGIYSYQILFKIFVLCALSLFIQNPCQNRFNYIILYLQMVIHVFNQAKNMNYE